MTMGITSPTSTTGQILKDGTAVISFDANNNATFAGTVVSNTPLGMRNRIINGDMRIDQRNAGASVTITNTADRTYLLDRWAAYTSVTSKFSVQQDAGAVTPPVGFNDYLGVTSLSSYSSGSADEFFIQQRIEGYNIADLAWGTASAKTVTLSFQVRSSLTGTFSGAIANSAGNRAYVFSYSIPTANTWTTISVTITGDTSGTWLTTNGTGLRLTFNLGSGSSSLGTAGSWGSTNFNGATGSVSVVGTNGATFYITGVQLEIGTSATPFERRLYNQELGNCQRYYQLWDAISGIGYGSGTGVNFSFCFPTVMRASPTIGQTAILKVTDAVAADYSQSSTNIAITFGTRVSTSGVMFSATNFSGTVNYRPYFQIANETGKVTFSAEL